MLKGRIAVATKTTSDGLVAMTLREKTNTIEGGVSRKLFLYTHGPMVFMSPKNTLVEKEVRA